MIDNISILVKLFETLKASTDKNEQATQQLIVQQLELVGHIKHLPIQDLKDALTEHSKDSKKEVNDCTENVDIKTTDLMTELTKLNNKVGKMILVVFVAFTILMGSYVIIRTVADKEKLYDYEAIETLQTKAFNNKMNAIMVEIRKEMKLLHPNYHSEDDIDESVHK